MCQTLVEILLQWLGIPRKRKPRPRKAEENLDAAPGYKVELAKKKPTASAAGSDVEKGEKLKFKPKPKAADGGPPKSKPKPKSTAKKGSDNDAWMWMMKSSPSQDRHSSPRLPPQPPALQSNQNQPLSRRTTAKVMLKLSLPRSCRRQIDCIGSLLSPSWLLVSLTLSRRRILRVRSYFFPCKSSSLASWILSRFGGRDNE